MRSAECIAKSAKKEELNSLVYLMMGDKNKFLVSTAVALTLEWVQGEGEDEFDIDAFARQSVADKSAELLAKAEPVAEPVDVYNKALNAGGRED